MQEPSADETTTEEEPPEGEPVSPISFKISPLHFMTERTDFPTGHKLSSWKKISCAACSHR